MPAVDCWAEPGDDADDIHHPRDVVMSNHSEFDNALTKTRELASRGFGSNPFVTGQRR